MEIHTGAGGGFSETRRLAASRNVLASLSVPSVVADRGTLDGRHQLERAADLLADAKTAEDTIQNVIGVNGSGDLAQTLRHRAQFGCHKLVPLS